MVNLIGSKVGRAGQNYKSFSLMLNALGQSIDTITFPQGQSSTEELKRVYA